MTRRRHTGAGRPCRFAIALACLAAAALAACGSGRGAWTRAGASEDMVAADTDECETFAQAVSLAESAHSGDTYIGVTASGDIVTTELPGTDSLRYMRRVEAFEHCMAGRGYQRAAD